MPLDAERSQIEAAATLDPDVLPANLDIAKIAVRDLLDSNAQEFRLWERLGSAFGDASVQHVIMTPWLKRGGADLVVANLAASLSRIRPDENVLVVCTHARILEALDWLAIGERSRVVCVDDAVDERGDVRVAFCNWLSHAGCANLYIVNSEYAWKLVIGHGAAIRRFTSIFAFAFAYAYDRFGRRGGYAWGPLRKAWPFLDALASDNAAALAHFERDHFISNAERDRLRWVPQPVDPKLKGRLVAPPERTSNPRVLWAGRFAREKGMDVALRAAVATPEADFCFHGGTSDELLAFMNPLPGNVSAHGPYEAFRELPLETFTLLLHSSHSDGMPNVLLEAGLAGLPIVATDVGGVHELVDEATGWLIPHGADAAVYRDAILAIASDPARTAARREAMRTRVETRHDPSAFDASVEAMLVAAERARGR